MQRYRFIRKKTGAPLMELQADTKELAIKSFLTAVFEENGRKLDNSEVMERVGVVRQTIFRDVLDFFKKFGL